MSDIVSKLQRQNYELAAALKVITSAAGSINSGKQHAMTVYGDAVFMQRKEWVDWILNEIVPDARAVLAKFEEESNEQSKSEPVPYDVNGATVYIKPPLYVATPERNPMTDEAIDDLYYIATNQSLRPQDKELAYSFARAIEAAHGIKE